jgi:hypothetical protein
MAINPIELYKQANEEELKAGLSYKYGIVRQDIPGLAFEENEVYLDPKEREYKGSYLIWMCNTLLEHRMAKDTGMSPECCLVCGEKQVSEGGKYFVDTEVDFGVVFSAEDNCKGCNLYKFEMMTGTSQEWIGFCLFQRSYTEDNDDSKEAKKKRKEEQKLRIQALHETRQMAKDVRCAPFIEKITETPDDNGARLVFADFLAENTLYPLNEQGLRDLTFQMRDCEQQPTPSCEAEAPGKIDFTITE